jgi:hypothetical protein
MIRAVSALNSSLLFRLIVSSDMHVACRTRCLKLTYYCAPASRPVDVRLFLSLYLALRLNHDRMVPLTEIAGLAFSQVLQDHAAPHHSLGRPWLYSFEGVESFLCILMLWLVLFVISGQELWYWLIC